MTVGERIKNRRKELGMTQIELAKKMGYKDNTSVSHAETCGNNIQVTKIAKFARYLDCSFNYLMGFEDEVKPEVPKYDDDTIEIIELLDRITPEQKKTILTMLRAFVNG